MAVTIPNPAPTMRDLRDIRSDLEQRISALETMLKDEIDQFQTQQEKAISTHKKQVDAFNQALNGYRRMLLLEETLADANIIGTNDKVGPMPAEIKIPVSKLPLADFFIAKLQENGPMSKDELRQAAKDAGYFPESDGGRATHATLINITRNQRIASTSDNKFIARQRHKEAELL